jgi:hypothetical protein
LSSTTTTSTSTTSNLTSAITSSTTMTFTKISSVSGISDSNSLLFTSLFNIEQLNSSLMTNLLNSNYDLSGCIVNCSNNGQCKFDSLINNFFCSCNSIYLSGYACQIDSRPCSSNPCLNNATCVDYSNSKSYNSSSFSCLCDEYHSGAYCESEIDICQNETCSRNGNCFDLNKKPKCKCFNMYSGDRCELESNELKTTKQIISYSTIIAIAVIIMFYCCFFLMDISKYLCKKNRHPSAFHKKAVIMRKYTYVS